jgi:ketosteroid isomerase-like protein
VGVIAATGRDVQIRVIDVLALTDGRISAIHVVADNLALGMQLGALGRA